MAIVVEIPQDLESQLRAEWPELERHALEGFVTEAFRSGKLSSHEVEQLLGLGSRWKAMRFLEQRGAYPGYDEDELMTDRTTLQRVLQGQSQ